jgi:hypothetical protein
MWEKNFHHNINNDKIVVADVKTFYDIGDDPKMSSLKSDYWVRLVGHC